MMLAAVLRTHQALCPRLIFVCWGIFLQLWQGWVLTGFHNPLLSPVIDRGP